MRGQIIAKQAGVVAGLDVAQAVFHLLDERVQLHRAGRRRRAVTKRQVLATLTGPARALLTAERTALNFLGRMSGIATLTRQFVDAVAGTKRRHPRHAQDRARPARCWTSWPCGAAAGRTTASGCTT